MGRGRDHVIGKSGVNVKGHKRGAIKLTHLLSERQNTLDQVPGEQSTAHMGKWWGRDMKDWGFISRAWESSPLLAQSLSLVLLSLLVAGLARATPAGL